LQSLELAKLRTCKANVELAIFDFETVISNKILKIRKKSFFSYDEKRKRPSQPLESLASKAFLHHLKSIVIKGAIATDNNGRDI
jgi:hypothetical protein